MPFVNEEIATSCLTPLHRGVNEMTTHSTCSKIPRRRAFSERASLSVFHLLPIFVFAGVVWLNMQQPYFRVLVCSGSGKINSPLGLWSTKKQYDNLQMHGFEHVILVKASQWFYILLLNSFYFLRRLKWKNVWSWIIPVLLYCNAEAAADIFNISPSVALEAAQLFNDPV